MKETNSLQQYYVLDVERYARIFWSISDAIAVLLLIYNEIVDFDGYCNDFNVVITEGFLLLSMIAKY